MIDQGVQVSDWLMSLNFRCLVELAQEFKVVGSANKTRSMLVADLSKKPGIQLRALESVYGKEIRA